VTDLGEALPSSVAYESAFEGALLDSLAVIRTSSGRALTPGLAALRGALGHGREGDGLVVAVFGALSPEEARTVAAVRRGTATCVAVLVDAADPEADTDGGKATARLLRGAGWRVVTVRSAAELAAAWAQADQATEDLARGTGSGASPSSAAGGGWRTV
jgi:hypothetical protein